MEKEVRKTKRLQINAAIGRRIGRMGLNNYQISKKSALTATQVKDMVERDYAYTVDSFIALLSALDIDLLELVKSKLDG